MVLIQGSITKASTQETSISKNPYTTKLKLVLTDFQPNENKQGIPLEEKDNLANSAMFMPIKVDYKRDTFGDHDKAIPIGPITHVFMENDILYAEAVIWDEYFKEVSTFITEKLDNGESVKASWEIAHTGVEEIDGIQWLRGCTLLGHCFVENPAYKDRVRVISVASTGEKEKMDELNRLIEMFNSMYAKITGITVEGEKVSEEKTFASIQPKLEERLNTIESAYTSAVNVAERLKKLAKVMDIETLPLKSIASMNEDAFELFVTVASAKVAEAPKVEQKVETPSNDSVKQEVKEIALSSVKSSAVPDIEAKEEDTEELSLDSLSSALFS